MDSVDALVVGAGPAGLTAAIYLRRYGRSVCLADTGSSRALAIERSHNVPGFPAGLPGRELLARLHSQLAAAEGRVSTAEVTRIVPWPALADPPGAVPTHARGDAAPGHASAASPGFAAVVGGHALHARTVLLACGVVDRVPAVDGIDAVRAAGRLRQCPICDGPEHRGQRIAVIGDGEHARREAAFLGHYSDRVTVWPPQALERVETLPPPDAPPAAGPDASPALRLHARDGRRAACDVVYAACGVEPRNALAAALGLACDDGGCVEVDARCATALPGVWAAGDLVSALDQIAVALGHGAIAATAMHNALRRADGVT